MGDLDHILGNEIIKNHFRTAVKNHKVSHAYILEGERGCGKKMLSAAFAKILQCETQSECACGSCVSCVQMDHKDHPDVIWVSHEKPNTISVGEIREQVVNTIDVKPYKGPYKIYIIDEAEKLNDAAQNAILKTIEEPPEYAIIFLLTSNKGVFLPTILSRCIQLGIKPIQKQAVKRYLMKEYTIEEEKAEFFAGYSMGNIGKALEAFSSEEFNQVRDMLLQILREINQSALYQIYASLKELKKQKKYYGDIFDILMIWYHDILILKSSGREEAVILKEEKEVLDKQKDDLDYENIENIINRIIEARAQIRVNVMADGAMESLFFDMKRNYQRV